MSFDSTPATLDFGAPAAKSESVAPDAAFVAEPADKGAKDD